MIDRIQIRIWLLACTIPVAPAAVLAADDDGRLIMYSHETESGTVAKREFRDEKGRLAKEIFYTRDWQKHELVPTSGPTTTPTTRPSGFFGPFDPDKLRAMRVRTYDYDDRDRRVRESTFSADGTLQSFCTTEYSDGTAPRIRRSFRPYGHRISQSHRDESGRWSLVRFDRSGHRVVQLSGSMPDNERWADEWGTPVDGLTCRIDANFASAPVRNASVTMTVRSTGSSASIRHGFSVEEVRPDLRDLHGNVVPIDEAARQRRAADLHRMNPNYTKPNTISVGAGEAVWASSFGLWEWYPDLPAGSYRLSIQRRSTGESFDLDSNTIQIEIIPPGSPVTP